MRKTPSKLSSFATNLTKRFRVSASFASWNTARWVHYSNFPMVKTNPKASHLDPFGVYFFPEKFKTEGAWHTYKYKYYASIPDDLKVLDLSKLNRDDILKMIAGMGATDHPHWEMEYKKLVETSERYLDNGWEWLTRFFMGKKATFNKKLRNLGYDAVFDDQGVILTNEIQLLILDPTKFKILEREERKGSGFDFVNKVLWEIEDICKNYGAVDLKAPMKKWSGYDQFHMLVGRLEVKGKVQEEEREATWEVSTSKPQSVKRSGTTPTQVSAFLLYHSPRAFESSIGFTLDIERPDWKGLRKAVTDAMAKIWGEKRGITTP